MNRGQRRPWAIAGGLIGTLFAASCVGTSQDSGAPGLSSEPAFVVIRSRQAPCETGICPSARIKNVGERSGNGNCTVWGLVDGSNDAIEGPTTPLTFTEPGDSLVLTVEWQGEVPSGGFTWDCSPTLQS